MTSLTKQDKMLSYIDQIDDENKELKLALKVANNVLEIITDDYDIKTIRSMEPFSIGYYQSRNDTHTINLFDLSEKLRELVK